MRHPAVRSPDTEAQASHHAVQSNTSPLPEAEPRSARLSPPRDISSSERLTVKSFRRFLSNYSPMFALAAVIASLYVMAAFIGLSLNINI